MLNITKMQWKMRAPLFSFVVNLVLTFVIIVCAFFGAQFGVPGLDLPISLIWPATGVSLASLLIFGFRVWPGIFVAYLIYNFNQIFISSDSILPPLIVTTIFSLGSLIQALIAAYIIRILSRKPYFKNVSDVFVFLIPAGLLSCLIASTLGVTTLFFYEGYEPDRAFSLWVSFWLGDTFGVYIFTPLLVIWMTQNFPLKLRGFSWEIFAMLFVFMLLSVLILNYQYPFIYMFLPLLIWVTYRFRMHGATLAVFLITVISTWTLMLGSSVFKADPLLTPLFNLIAFLSVIVFTALVFAAVMEERQEVLEILKKQNIKLSESVDTQINKIDTLMHDMLVKNKLASIGAFTCDVICEIGRNLRAMKSSIDESRKRAGQLKNELLKQKKLKRTLQKEFDSIERNFKIFENQEKNAAKALHAIEKQSLLTEPERLVVKSANLQTLINLSLEHVLSGVIKKDPDLNLICKKKYSDHSTMIHVLAEDLSDAMIILFENALHYIKEKKIQAKRSHQVELSIQTKKVRECIEIKIQDNGINPIERLNKIKDMYLSNDPYVLKLTMACDIIEKFHCGTVKFDANDKFFCVYITLPKKIINV